MGYSSDQMKKEYKEMCEAQRKNNLIRLREEIAKLTQADFKEEIGFTKNDLSMLESGDKNLSLFHIQAYKKYFKENYHLDISVDFLMGYTSVMENNSMDISHDLGLSGKSLELLRIWNEYKQNPMNGVISYGVADIDTLNLLLEDYYTLYKNARQKGLYAGYSIFHFIGNYIFSERFKKCPQNIVKYTHSSSNPEIGNPLTELRVGDIVISDNEEYEILDIKTYDKYNSGADSETFHIYNTENEKEVYNVKFQNVMSAYNKENIISIIDKIKERTHKNETT